MVIGRYQRKTGFYILQNAENGLLVLQTVHAFSVLHACSLPTTPTLLAHGDATVHARG